MRGHRVVGSVLIALVLAACGCSDVGCDSAIIVDLGTVDLRPETPYEYELCFDGLCETGDVTIPTETIPTPTDPEYGYTDPTEVSRTTAGFSDFDADNDVITIRLPHGDRSPTARVTVVLRERGVADPLIEAYDVDVELERSQPNGRGCEPICHWGTVTLSSTA
jgi:hypothetical protein